MATPILSAALIAPAHAQDELILVEPVSATTYINGGVGSDDEARMHRIAGEWPLRMIFSERKDNEFIADVDLLVTDIKGKPLLQLPDAGPMTYAVVPPGKYRISATYEGLTEIRDVTIAAGNGRDVIFHWKGTAKS